jgi:hypothetical protein
MERSCFEIKLQREELFLEFPTTPLAMGNFCFLLHSSKIMAALISTFSSMTEDDQESKLSRVYSVLGLSGSYASKAPLFVGLRLIGEEEKPNLIKPLRGGGKG